MACILSETLTLARSLARRAKEGAGAFRLREIPAPQADEGKHRVAFAGYLKKYTFSTT